MYDHVIWPERYDPKTSAIYALNDIDVKAPPEVVWKLLVDAENWSSYFPAEDQVNILGGKPELALQIHPGDGWLSDESGRDGVRTLPQAGMGDNSRWRRYRIERVPRLGHHSYSRWLPCADRRNAAGPLVP
ncbi:MULTISPECIES: hypothetical protein [Mesorhizobium]|uniref:hypothetical protein n=1 Tax=Mesorhizobium TaxID=68287 RepID=UPI001FD8EC29|nr:MULTISPECIES: hypothetical protein [Mesorhizobium]WJI39196.1 hypothetical protein NL534_02735 [Mesorhizobium opportunistum]